MLNILVFVEDLFQNARQPKFPPQTISRLHAPTSRDQQFKQLLLSSSSKFFNFTNCTRNI